MTRILIADDNAINRKLLAWQLETLGFACDDANSGQSALDACLDREFDLIFMDVNLGDMDGYGVTRTLREREGDADPYDRRTPIVAVTAHVGREERERCLGAGMDDFLSKPITLGPLAQLLIRWGINGFDADLAANPADRPAAAAPADSPLLLQPAVDWLRALEQNSAHAGLAREVADDFLAQVPAHVRQLHGLLGGDDEAQCAKMCFAITKHARGIGAARLAAAIAAGRADGRQWLADIDETLAATSDEIRREFM